MTNIAGVAVVKNEQDIIESFVRYNLQYLDSLFIIDHNSIDGTRNILNSLEQEGLPIKIYTEKKLEFYQDVFIDKLIRDTFNQTKVDYIFTLDADEFIVTESRESLEKVIINLLPESFGLIPWKTYVTLKPDLYEAFSPLDAIKFRRILEEPQYYKAIITKLYMSSKKFKISKGNHKVNYRGRKFHHVKLPNIYLAHFPVRSVEQLTAKVVLNWLGSLMTDSKLYSKKQSIHIRGIYEKVLKEGNLTPEEVIKISKYYALKGKSTVNLVEDPLYFTQRLRYTHENHLSPIQLVVKNFENYILANANKPFYQRLIRIGK